MSGAAGEPRKPGRIHWHEANVPPDTLVVWRTQSWERTYIAADVIERLLPAIYDGTHIVDCPYIDVLLRIKDAVDGESSPESHDAEGSRDS